jgi:hypothetical protein
MSDRLAWAIFAIGFAQLAVLGASALVPIRLKWRTELATLPRLYRQLFWVYGGYVVLGIVSLGLVCITQSTALASGSPLARAVCLYGAVFWGVRLSLQAVFDAKPFLSEWWLKAAYHTLTFVFAVFVAVYVWAVVA